MPSGAPGGTLNVTPNAPSHGYASDSRTSAGIPATVTSGVTTVVNFCPATQDAKVETGGSIAPIPIAPRCATLVSSSQALQILARAGEYLASAIPKGADLPRLVVITAAVTPGEDSRGNKTVTILPGALVAARMVTTCAAFPPTWRKTVESGLPLRRSEGSIGV